MTLARLLLALACGWSTLAAGHEVTDETGTRVHLDAPPARIVSLLPSLTETVCALGACARLVGVDRFSNWPPEVRQLPQLGGGVDPHIEAVVRTRPDLVLVSHSGRVAERLRALGLKVVVLEPKNHADVRRVLGTVGQLLGLPESAPAAVWQRIEQGLDEAAAMLPAQARQARVYIEVSRGPYAASAGSFIGETLARLGVANVVPATLGPFPKLNPEYVVRADPDILMLANRTMQAEIDYPGWRAMRAVREQRICLFSLDDAETVVRPGPRMDQAARVMAQCLKAKAP
ncbi:ABC transporter substrate-binding protein [Pseudorhodoferax sp. Leaf265]|uniref:ABC transporter substrate-binding protein n=1 Tax=Pseudorhodoferax sp. Leaf265 TaxID=1736315 RepID=UPI0006F3BD21|nr:helical backbone metal receptor [Pseudorhodoferax sp. Leaf265]KQP02434.1 ABC transporter substrate-binding protein [Pseudorhodoferax sp. Leaf265]PZP96903.1 MAG: ABC transporter substrate-binding protein [Variovorax paradoxus]PZQ08039.1 MAG: ABC transporter substrate-binding protein [Variovorax paradoxus]